MLVLGCRKDGQVSIRSPAHFFQQGGFPGNMETIVATPQSSMNIVLNFGI